MNKKLKRLIISLLITPFLLTACGTKISDNKPANNSKEVISSDEETKYRKVQGNKEDFDQLLDSINLSRKEVFANAPIIKDEYINWFEKGEEEFSKEEVKEIADYAKELQRGGVVRRPELEYDANKVLTYEDAKEDIDRLFKLFRYCYGPYGYFGGDEVFNEAKTAIMNDMEGKKEISSLDFKGILTKNFDFIYDAHFFIGQDYDTYSKLQMYYMYPEEFHKDDKGYYRVVEQKNHYLKGINNDSDIEKYMKVSINEEGQLVYKAAILKQSSKNRSVNVPLSYSIGEETIEEKVYFDIMWSIPRNKVDKFEYRLIDNIPVAKVAAMSDNDTVKDSQSRFMKSAEEMKEYPISILDLRANEGGYRTSGEAWIETFSGKSERVEAATVFVNSSITNEIFQTYNKKPFELLQKESIIPERIPNDKLVFVLINNFTASAGEWFVEELFNMDNVIFIGTNTMGCKISNKVNYRLENSKIDLGIGDALTLSPYGEDFEYKGFQPDILVESDKALDRLLKMIEYYGISENKKE